MKMKKMCKTSSSRAVCIAALALLVVLIGLYATDRLWLDARTIASAEVLALAPLYCVIGIALDIAVKRKSRNGLVELHDVAFLVLFLTILVTSLTLLRIDTLLAYYVEALKSSR